LRTDGRFVRAADLEAAKPSDFAGVELGKRADLPLAFVVKRGVRSFRLTGSEAEKGDLVEYHSELPLSGRFRSIGNVKYWAFDGAALRPSDAGQELWVRHQDVTVVQRRATFPELIKDDERWLDVSVTTGTLVAYEGKRAVFATLLSVARELPEGGEGTQPASVGPRPIPLGTTSVRQKALTFGGSTANGFDDADDVPWALELGSGQLLHGAYWHDRFGIEHGAGSFALSPSDAARLFRFVGPELPSGWHAVVAAPETATRVVIRK
ncbi:MAG TPA: L,D-transpeptidase, partial [Polyangiaceae bacterium]|nr:L,D-transpeptidase [Polyangiaceae bacterium]